MKLSLVSPHKSISQFSEVELPNFSLITGLNGSGKSHLLDAIVKGHIASGFDNRHIRLFDWTTFQTKDNAVGSHDIYQPSLNLEQAIPTVVQIARDSPESEDKLREEIKKRSRGYAVFFLKALEAHGVNVLSSRERLQQIIREDPFAASAGDFTDSISSIFFQYQQLVARNRIRDDNDTDRLNHAAFRERYGPPPWEVLKELFRSLKLNFSIKEPDVLDYHYHAQLTHKDNGSVIKLNELSSGEKTLVRLALCAYHRPYGPIGYSTERLRLLLLDEIDATLHPSMVRVLVKTIKKTLVEDRDISVILTTHSPSTVAMFDDDCIYSMERNPCRLRKATKSEAIQLLTAGIPTLSIDFEGRRQVFVEAETDMKWYGTLYAALKYHGHISSERSLEFIAVGTKNKDGSSHGGGSGSVRNMVNDLANMGNKSVFGIVDWDGKTNPNKRVKVLAHGVRYSIENVVLDPRLLGLFLLHENADCTRCVLSLSPKDAPQQGYENLTSEELAPLVKAIQLRILPKGFDEGKATSSVEYVDGIRLDIYKEYLEMNGHELADSARSEFGFLNQSKLKNNNALVRAVVTRAKEYPQLFPNDVKQIFETILELEVEAPALSSK